MAPLTQLQDYQDLYRSAAVERSPTGVLVVRIRNGDEPLVWSPRAHAELPELFAAIAADRENRVVVITGTGDTFIDWPEGHGRALAEGQGSPELWDRILFEGKRLIMQLLDIEVPVIAAVNGPALAHSELAVLADVVLAADHAVFQDAAHFVGGLVPGDGMQVIWPLLLGPNRGRHFLLTGRVIDATEAERLGVVGEVLTAEELMPRALELAENLAAMNPLLLRYSRQVMIQPLKKAMLDQLQLGLALEALASISGRDEPA